MLDDFVRVARFAVAYAEIDMNRHANNTAYLRWAEQGRVDYVAEVFREEIAGRRGLILRKTEALYERPLLYRERVAFGTRVARIGTRSLLFASDCVSEDAGALAATIACTCVAYDYEAQRSIPVPEAWTQRILALERTAPLRA